MPSLPPRRCSGSFVLTLVAGLFFIRSASGQAPLHERIDQLVRRGHKDYAQVAAPVSDDAEFVRRIYLDITGIIPTADEARAFLAERAPDRRGRLIDRLLASEKSAFHLADVYDVLLMDRRPDKHVKRPDWLAFLRGAFRANRPYDQLVRDILSADGSEPTTRAAARFVLDREGEPHLLTRDIGRLFLGMNLQCAQCHDHPLVDAYKQDHYYGIFAFFSRSYLYTDKAAKLTVLAEKGDGEVSFQSVFMAKVVKNTGPHLPDVAPIVEPKFDKGQEYVKPFKTGERGIPKFSRRAQLAGKLTAADNPRFARSAVNRVWAQYLGRGLVHPVEYDHAGNPPSHPELLALLTDEFVAHHYDLRWLTREILLSETYQRSSAAPAGTAAPDPAWFAVAALRPLSPEQFAWSLLQATGQLERERQALGTKATEAALQARLAPQTATFASLFGGQPGVPASAEDFNATVGQTLFLRNGSAVRGWLAPGGGNLTERLLKLADTSRVADELYVSVLTRYPAQEERRWVAEFLTRRTEDRAAAVADSVWAMVSSAEFRFNH